MIKGINIVNEQSRVGRTLLLKLSIQIKRAVTTNVAHKATKIHYSNCLIFKANL